MSLDSLRMAISPNLGLMGELLLAGGDADTMVSLQTLH